MPVHQHPHLTNLDRVPRVAGRQAGVFTAAQALHEGWTARQVRRRRESGRWRRVAGIGLAGGGTWVFSALQLGIAAELTWSDVVVSHRTAAGIHGLPVPHSAQAHVITHRGRSSRRGIVAHVLTIGDEDVVAIGTLNVTSVKRTVFDMVASSSLDENLDLWAYVTTRRLVQRHDLLTAIDERSRSPGIDRLRMLADLTTSGAVSGAEIRLHEALHAAGITGWVAAGRIEDSQGLIGVVDLVFAAAKVVVEVDGWRAHSSPEAFQRDRDRQNRLAAAGYVTLRVTAMSLRQRPRQVVAQIEAVLTQRLTSFAS